MKKCPFCAEEIQSEAIKCRYCGEWLESKPTAGDSGKQAKGQERPSDRDYNQPPEALNVEPPKASDIDLGGYRYTLNRKAKGEAFCIGCRKVDAINKLHYCREIDSYYHKECLIKQGGVLVESYKVPKAETSQDSDIDLGGFRYSPVKGGTGKAFCIGCSSTDSMDKLYYCDQSRFYYHKECLLKEVMISGSSSKEAPSTPASPPLPKTVATPPINSYAGAVKHEDKYISGKILGLIFFCLCGNIGDSIIRLFFRPSNLLIVLISFTISFVALGYLGKLLVELIVDKINLYAIDRKTKVSLLWVVGVVGIICFILINGILIQIRKNVINNPSPTNSTTESSTSSSNQSASEPVVPQATPVTGGNQFEDQFVPVGPAAPGAPGAAPAEPVYNKPQVVTAVSHFSDYGRGTVLDTKTNLMWAAKDNGSDINWGNAKAYCKNFRGGGYTDWRMPTQDELVGLYDASKSQKVKCGNYPNHIATDLIHLSCWYAWSSETRGSDAAYFGFLVGARDWNTQTNAHSNRVLPVRSTR